MQLTQIMVAEPRDEGETISFVLYGDGEPYEFECVDGDVSKIIVGLQHAAHAALEARASSAFKGLNQGTDSFFHTRQFRLGRFADGALALVVVTEEGIPLKVSMTADQANDLVPRIVAELRKPPPQGGN